MTIQRMDHVGVVVDDLEADIDSGPARVSAQRARRHAGGVVEPGESLADAVVRKIREGTGLITNDAVALAWVCAVTWTRPTSSLVGASGASANMYSDTRHAEAGRVRQLPRGQSP